MENIFNYCNAFLAVLATWATLYPGIKGGVSLDTLEEKETDTE